MTWPHRVTDSRWIRAFRWLCGVSVILALVWPGLTPIQRGLVGVFALYGLGGAFLNCGLVLFLVRSIPLLNRGLAYLVFYGALINVILVPLRYSGGAWVGGLKADYSGAVEFALTLPSNLGALAAGFNALQRTVRGAAFAS